jgi:DNA polymerase III subunit epsilon
MTTWRDAHLVAIDLEGSGAQDRDNEAILEIAAVPLANGIPDAARAYSTLVSPGRKIRRGPWISPGLTNTVLADAPALGDIEAQLAPLLNGAVLVGHNIAVDWRLLRRRCPTIAPAGLLDTLRLAKHHRPHDASRTLTALVEQLELTAETNRLATASQPHRALWDATATGLLLHALVTASYNDEPTLRHLLDIASRALTTPENDPLRLF